MRSNAMMSNDDAIPEACFANFLAGLRSQALIHLGVLANPHGSVQHTRPDMARYTLQLLEILRTKTTGNCDQDEQQLLDAIIAELTALLDQQQDRS